ncbi:MAG: RluA family pseudouridine synthase [Actinobacteria bacterium]|nr:RluA family pseudouridine synthase [Actinomycetota bacterium]
MTTRVRFAASEEDLGQRVDVVVAKRSGVTRAAAQRALRNGEVTVRGDAVRPSYRLERGDDVRGEITPGDVPAPEAEDIPIEVRYSDERVLVVSKPAGLVTHPARGHLQGTLVNALLGLGVDLSGKGSTRPGIVHRLDKDTSGLLLIAKDDDAQTALVAAMQRREIERRYLALVRGRLPAESGTVEAPIGRHPTRRTRMAVVADGRRAVSHYEVLETSARFSFVEVTLETGRTHQIRVHMAHLGNPVLGDRTYGGVGELSRDLGLERPFLHAWKLAFPSPADGTRIEVTDELPDDLGRVLGGAGLSTPS